ncbi:MAG: hypothetical protein A2939_05260 [Parcubacteria group bacterium RIFCSPLOWO2_01_FULL_48_18]|nr:MAG: hypothetical protein A3J67_06710 [Parcubacteria group bacterium RIFCSPHIGHO2_02_FULL_48_10b]OHB22508.1 MAG: hypothetical protein A2939_05260 [Parcubacteria group bacterium RIFCSPLOWO2_01_FULL_48_18]
MKQFELLPHTADIRLKVYGRDLKELFINAVKALAFLLKEEVDQKKTRAAQQTVSATSNDIPNLLVDFLSEILTRSEIHNIVYPEVEDMSIQPLRTTHSAEAILIGYPVEKFDRDVKAVTYHEVDIERNDEGMLETLLVFDI